MPGPRAGLPDSSWRGRVFSLLVMVTLALVGFVGLVLVHPALISGVLGHETAGHISGHFRFPHHRTHDVTFGLIFATAVLGMLAQLRRPSQNFAGQLVALIPWIALLLAFALARTWLVFAPSPILGALTLAATILHPARRDVFRSFRASRVNRVMLALVIIAAVPLLTFASTNVGLQRTLTNDHAALGHYGFMAAFSLTVIGVGVLASMRLDGWRLPAQIGGSLPALLGITSLLYPGNDSSLSPVWAVAAILWGAVFVAAAELMQDRRRAT